MRANLLVNLILVPFLQDRADVLGLLIEVVPLRKRLSSITSPFVSHKYALLFFLAEFLNLHQAFRDRGE